MISLLKHTHYLKKKKKEKVKVGKLLLFLKFMYALIRIVFKRWPLFMFFLGRSYVYTNALQYNRGTVL